MAAFLKAGEHRSCLNMIVDLYKLIFSIYAHIVMGGLVVFQNLLKSALIKLILFNLLLALFTVDGGYFVSFWGSKCV